VLLPVDQLEPPFEPVIEPGSTDPGGAFDPLERLLLTSELMECLRRGPEDRAVLGLALVRRLEAPERTGEIAGLESLRTAAEPLGRGVPVGRLSLLADQGGVDLRVLDARSSSSEIVREPPRKT